MLPALVFTRLRKGSNLALIAGLAVFVWAAGARAEVGMKGAEAGPGTQEAAGGIDNERLEKAMQSLSWEQFKAVLSSIPKLKADVDAYGPLGWQYVQANYRTYPWRKNLRKLKEPQKKELSDLIDEAREGFRPAAD